MFENVREDIEANRPDRFVGMGGQKTVHLSAGQPGREGDNPSGLWKSNTNVGLQRADTGLSEGFLKMKEKISDLKDVGSATTSEAHHLRSTLNDDLLNLKSQLRQKMSEIERLERDVEAESQRAFQAKHAELSRRAENKVTEMADLEKEIESYGRQEVEKKEHDIEVKATDAAADASGRIQATLELKDPFKEEKRDL